MTAQESPLIPNPDSQKMKYHIRFKHSASNFQPLEAESVAEAACIFLEKNCSKALFVRPENAGRTDGETSFFAVVDIQGEGEFLTRYFTGCIGRTGGIKPPKNPNERLSLAAVERDLGLSAGDIEQAEWEGEESVEDAWNRQRGYWPGARP